MLKIQSVLSFSSTLPPPLPPAPSIPRIIPPSIAPSGPPPSTPIPPPSPPMRRSFTAGRGARTPSSLNPPGYKRSCSPGLPPPPPPAPPPPPPPPMPPSSPSPRCCCRCRPAAAAAAAAGGPARSDRPARGENGFPVRRSVATASSPSLCDRENKGFVEKVKGHKARRDKKQFANGGKRARRSGWGAEAGEGREDRGGARLRVQLRRRQARKTRHKPSAFGINRGDRSQ